MNTFQSWLSLNANSLQLKPLKSAAIGLKYALLALLVASSLAEAHTRWDPTGLVKPRTNDTNGKVSPCGGHTRGEPVVLQAGSTVEVAFESNIYHQGAFRIAFSPANDQGFDDHVLADNIPDIENQPNRTHTITLPDIACTDCTLQLIQTMLDRSPPSNYFSCADIQLVRANPEADITPPGSVSHLLAMVLGHTVDLTWTNPADQDLSGVLVVQGVNNLDLIEQGRAYETGDSIGQGEVVYVGLTPAVTLQYADASTLEYAVAPFDTALNYGAAITTSAVLNAVENLAPNVALMVEQNQVDGPNVTTDQGWVTVQARVTDPNPADDHTYTWAASDPVLIDVRQLSSDSSPNAQYLQFVLDPSTLAEGDYTLTFTATDNGIPPLSSSSSVALKVSEPAAGAGLGLSTLVLLLMLSARRRCRFAVSE